MCRVVGGVLMMAILLGIALAGGNTPVAAAATQDLLRGTSLSNKLYFIRRTLASRVRRWSAPTVGICS
jgi:hypothetical protein